MADRMIRRNYTEMSNSLYQFAAQVDALSTDLQTNVNICRQYLGEEDQSVKRICADMDKINVHYLQLARQAIRIAQAMVEEADQLKREESIWDGE